MTTSEKLAVGIFQLLEVQGRDRVLIPDSRRMARQGERHEASTNHDTILVHGPGSSYTIYTVLRNAMS